MYIQTTKANLRGYMALSKSRQQYPGHADSTTINQRPEVTYKFDIALKDLIGVTVEYETSYDASVIFKNLALIPGKKAHPKVEIIEEKED